MIPSELKEFLDEKVALYNHPTFIESDPIQIPHRYKQKEDIEIAGFLAATIAWGNRKMIIKSASKLMEAMGDSPYDFVLNHREKDLSRLDHFVHRTFNHEDVKYFIKSLKNIYQKHTGLETIFAENTTNCSTQKAISEFKKIFFEIDHLSRTTKHISDPLNGSAAKRINMLMRLNNVANI